MEAEDRIIDNQIEAKKLILAILEEDERCRNDDKALILEVWRRQGAFINLNKEGWTASLSLMFNPETIIRNRAVIQNEDHKFLPTDPQVLIKRKIKEEVLRHYFAKNQRKIQEWEILKYGVV